MEKISVIVPIYKVEQYIRQCLDSIVGQTYQNLEIILIDDGSPDQCGKICDEYAKQDMRIRVIHKENQGISEAYRDALKVATGDWLSFVDSDDWLELDMYESLIQRLKQLMGVDIIIFNHFLKKRDERKIQEFDSEFVTDDVKSIYGLQCAVLCKAYTTIKCNHLQGVVWNKMYKRELFSQFSGEDLLPRVRGGARRHNKYCGVSVCTKGSLC